MLFENDFLQYIEINFMNIKALGSFKKELKSQWVFSNFQFYKLSKH